MIRQGVWVVVGLAACNGDRVMVSGSANVRHGPTGMTPLRATGPVPAPASGRWALTPDKAKITLISVSFTDGDGQPANAPLTDCSPVYDRTAGTLAQLLSCPFEVPVGTYGAVGISINTTYELLLDDSVNGFFTDGSGVVTTSPGTPQFTTFTAQGAGGVGNSTDGGSFLPEPFVVEEGKPVELELVVDMLHMLAVDVSGSTATVETDVPGVPAVIIPSVSGAGRSEFFSERSTAANMLVGPPGSTGTWGGVRAFYATPPQPSFIYYPLPGPSMAYNVDPAKAPPNGTPDKAGGYLGIDGTNTMCWAMPANDATYTTYDRVCQLPLGTGIGGTATLSCQLMSTAPAPVSGDTYASGCPAITPDITVPLTLVAQ